MGNQYTKEEKIEFVQYKTIIDKAVFEKDKYIVFKQVRKTLNKNLLERKK